MRKEFKMIREVIVEAKEVIIVVYLVKYYLYNKK